MLSTLLGLVPAMGVVEVLLAVVALLVARYYYRYGCARRVGSVRATSRVGLAGDPRT